VVNKQKLAPEDQSKPRSCAIVVPVFNEAQNIEALAKSIESELERFSMLEPTLVLVNDGSTDGSWQKIKDLAYAKLSLPVYALNFSRNFGKESALTAGLHHATGYDFVISMDGDLQHPASILPKMIAAWQDGAEMVICIRKSTEKKSITRRLGSLVFYYILRSSTNLDIQANSTDFRLFDAKVVDAINRLGERVRFFRGIADWVGFKKAYVEFDAPDRIAGQSAFGGHQLVNLAVNSILAFSLWPLRMTAYLGMLVFMLCVPSLAFMIIDRFTINLLNAGPMAFVTMLNLTISSVMLMAIGVVAVYLGKVNMEIINRPHYIVGDTFESRTAQRSVKRDFG
jgi:dolichol-phosphate mannosyltransferase